nr:hypothetical protein [Treponemataceae bacterium]
IAMVLTGLSLFLTGRIKSRKMVLKYVFPAGMLCALGAIFLFFSFGVVTVPFSQFALLLAPLLLIASGIFLIVLFFQRKSLLELLPDEVSEEFDGGMRAAETADEDEIGEEL